jgi:hypothetical protein
MGRCDETKECAHNIIQSLFGEGTDGAGDSGGVKVIGLGVGGGEERVSSEVVDMLDDLKVGD